MSQSRASTPACLARNLSTPAHFRPPPAARQQLRRSSLSELAGPQAARAASTPASSLEPASSAASDSAFSQSQSTLGSEPGDQAPGPALYAAAAAAGSPQQPSGAKPLRKLQKQVGQRRQDLPEDYDDDDDDDDDDHVQLAHDDFCIVWRNLSYRVPDKKLGRLTGALGRLRRRLRGAPEPAPADLPAPQAGSGPPMAPPTVGKPRNVIFHNLNGCARSGHLTAILGPSGAGKTTLLKCLTSTIVGGVSGRIEVAGAPNGSSHHLKLCIIPQKDYLFDNLTVMENLLFASRIKNTQPHFEHPANVRRVVHLLGLEPCIKLKTSRLSGGQYKRVSIAQELLSKPDILILDEPTSGLDSLTCFRTVSVLRDLVDKSRAGLTSPLAIVMTIHQPQIKIFNLFHHVYIMSSTGHCVYEGRPAYLVDTVASCCQLLPPPDDMNPASFIIDLASEVYGREPIDKLTKLQRANSDLMAELRRSNDAGSLVVANTKLRKSKLANNSTSIISDSNNNNNNNNRDPNNNDQDPKLCSDTDLNNNNKQPIERAPIKLQAADLFCPNINIRAKAAQVDREAAEPPPPDPGDPRPGRLTISPRIKRCHNIKGSFWYHTRLLINRLWMSTWRDPLLTTTRVMFHVMIPFVFYFIYSQKSGAANACPHVEREVDLANLASQESIERLERQHNELILTFENVSLFFLLLYSFSMCVLAVTALSFPLNMQILLKETSNGWYTMPRFVMAKTLADLPIEVTMPMISVAIAYVLTGQPSSYLCWRLLAVTAVMTLCSLISQTQGLLFGAYFMNNIKAAVFVSQAWSLPWILLSGFTTRVSELPTLLRWLSFGSIYRLGIESIVAIRYGYGVCACDEELVNNTPTKVIGIPEQLRSVMRYYFELYSTTTAPVSSSMLSDTNPSLPSTSTISTTTSTTTASTLDGLESTTMSSGGDQGFGLMSNSVRPDDIFERIASTLSRANTYGVDVVTCSDVRPFILTAREVDEKVLLTFTVILILIFVFLKLLLLYVVRLRTS